MTSLPMFPLGTVLSPYLPLQLRVFEERYLVMLARILNEEPAEFGVVLIERGQEVGGGEHRFGFGTVAQIVQLEVSDGFVGLVAQGDRRFEVSEWLAEDPYPVAIVREVSGLDWDDDLYPLREKAESAVRQTLALASEFVDQAWSPDVELSEDPTAAAWQLAGITPVGPMDQISLLRATTMEGLLTGVLEYTTAAAESFRAPWPDE